MSERPLMQRGDGDVGQTKQEAPRKMYAGVFNQSKMANLSRVDCD